MRIVSACCLVLLFAACSQNKEPETQTPVPAPAPATDTLPYYDVRGTILSELSAIKNGRYRIYQYNEKGGKKDSVQIDTARLMQLAAPFYETDLNRPEIKKQYKESVFEDRDTRSFVLNYTVKEAALPVKSVSVMLDNVYQDVKRVDIMRSYHRGDTLYEERLAWTAGKKFHIVQLVSAGGTELTKQSGVTWHKRQ